MLNHEILTRLEELIEEGDALWEDYQNDPEEIKDPIRFTRWSTSCLNILDHLSITTNRFVVEFEPWVKRQHKMPVNIGAALGVLKSARDEYVKGFAVEYHLSVASTVFGDLLSQAEYLLNKGWDRAAAVLVGAALEEALKTRARASSIGLDDRETITPLLHKLKNPAVGIINELESRQLEVVAEIRNKAAHGGEFIYSKTDVEDALDKVRNTIIRILGVR